MKYAIRNGDPQRQEATNQPISRQQTADQRSALACQVSKELTILFYSISTSFSVIQSAFYMLKLKKISQFERDQYIEGLSRNLVSAESMLGNLKDILRSEAAQEIYLNKFTDVAELLKELKTQLPTTAPQEFEDQINQLTRLTESLTD